MRKIDFDDYADQYNDIMQNQLHFFSESSDYFSEYKVVELKKNLLFHPIKILDFGCGIGRSAQFLKKHFPNAEVSGFDVSEKSIEIARKQVKNALFLPLMSCLNFIINLILFLLPVYSIIFILKNMKI